MYKQTLGLKAHLILCSSKVPKNKRMLLKGCFPSQGTLTQSVHNVVPHSLSAYYFITPDCSHYKYNNPV